MPCRLIPLLALTVAAVAPAAAPAPPFGLWRPIEVTASLAAAAADTYRAPPVRAEFRGPDGEVVSVTGFSDDGRIYRFRTALGRTGEWTWELTDPERAARYSVFRGRIQVVSGAEGNPLYRHGFLQVSANRRHLAHADGTPFFWLGDTAWNGIWRGTPEEWRDYVMRRALQGFSVLLVHATNSKVVTDLKNYAGEAPFENGRPNPRYWDDFDAKIATANASGMLVLVTAIGRSSSLEWVEETSEPEFARYVAARLSGRFVVFSPSMDTAHTPVNDLMGRTLAETAPRHLRTQHVNTNLEAALAYGGADYVSFAAIQSGHARGSIPRTRQNLTDWMAAVQARAGAKPTFNLEAMYDVHGPEAGPSHRRSDARQLGYLSWLHGSLSYTYGTDGVWRWTAAGEPKSWRESLDWESAADMTRLRQFFAGLPWWDLAPASGALVGQPESPEKRAALAATSDRKLTVAFLPEGERISIFGPFVPESPAPVWYNPTTGERRRGALPEKGERNAFHFTAPAPGEWLLVLRSDSAYDRDRKPPPAPGAKVPKPTPPVLAARPLAPGEKFRIMADGYTGDEVTTEPKHDLNHGADQDSPYFRRHNVGRAHMGRGMTYWYTSKYQQPGEPTPGHEQWVDYVPPLQTLGAGRYRLALQHRVSDARASYPARVLVFHSAGISLVEVPQNTGDGAISVVLGEFDLGRHGWVRVVDEGAGSLVFGPLELTRL